MAFQWTRYRHSSQTLRTRSSGASSSCLVPGHIPRALAPRSPRSASTEVRPVPSSVSGTTWAPSSGSNRSDRPRGAARSGSPAIRSSFASSVHRCLAITISPTRRRSSRCTARSGSHRTHGSQRSRPTIRCDRCRRRRANACSAGRPRISLLSSGSPTARSQLVCAGAEGVQAYGIGDRGDLEALALAGWAEVRPISKLAFVGRFTTIGYATDGGRASSFGGAIALEPWRAQPYEPAHHSYWMTHSAKQQRCIGTRSSGYARLWLAIDRTTTSGAAMPIPGADAGAATTLLLIVSTTAPFTVD